MRIKSFKKILAHMLVATIMVPNLSVKAMDMEVIEGTLVGQEYEAKKVNIPFVETSDEYLAERIEYKLKTEALSDMVVLETKTDSEYEIALAHEDGTFTYVSSVDSIKEAMEEVETLASDLEEDPDGTVSKLTNINSRNSSAKLRRLNNSESESTALPAVINNSGQVVFSTNSMARIIKYINGVPDTSGLRVTNLYPTSALTTATGYINHMYVEDAPILQDAGNSARILVPGGHEAWINKNTTSSEYDMVVVPLNQVKNPSYYIVVNGELRHFISSNITGTSGHTITIGKAPSYLVAGVRYFSYDGLYFYNGQSIETGLNTLISDYKNNTRVNSVNPNNPYYLYFNYLPFRSRTVHTAADLDRFINENTQSTSKLRGLGSTLKSVEETYGVNAALTLGVAINESAWGMTSIAQSKNNLFGINAIDSNPGGAANEFVTPAASVVEFAKNYISRGYADPADWRYNGGFLGNKKNGANVRYASDPFWGVKASQFAYRIDRHISGSVNNLRDTDLYQLAMATTNNKVMRSDGSLLYNITSDKNQFAGYVETPFIISNNNRVSVGGQTTYEINPERTTPVNTGGTANKFHGNYDWTVKGYVIDSGIRFINSRIGVVAKAVSGVTLDKTSVTLTAGEWTSFVATVAPQDATNKSVTWKSSNSAVATVDSTGKVTAVTAGTATITVTSVDGGYNAEAIITVLSPVSNTITNSRLGGANRVKTSTKIADSFRGPSKLNGVILASAGNFPDALAGGVLTKKYNAPILLTNKTAQASKDTIDYIKENVNSDAQIVILGSTGVIDDSVVNALKDSGFTKIKRLGGADRFATNMAIINDFNPTVGSDVIVSYSHNFPDALSISPVSAIQGMPILLVNGKLTTAQQNMLSKVKPSNIYITGSTGVVPSTLENELKKYSSRVERLGGANRYETSKIINDKFKSVLTGSNVILANGLDFPDALSATALALKLNAPIILVNPKDTSIQKEFISNNNKTNVYVIGGIGAVSEATVKAILE